STTSQHSQAPPSCNTGCELRYGAGQSPFINHQVVREGACMLHLWGQTIVTHARHILAIGIPLLLLAAIHASGVFGTLTHGGFITPDSQSARELGVEHMVFGSH